MVSGEWIKPPVTPHHVTLHQSGQAASAGRVYPAGSLVQLTDDRYAIVMGVNSSRPLKPRVLVHEPRVPRSDALVLDLEHSPDLGVRRSLPAAKLPPAAVEYLDPRPRVAYYFEPLARHVPEELAA